MKEELVPFTPEWNQKRDALMADIMRRQKAHLTPAARKLAIAATNLAVISEGMVGYEEAKAAYRAAPSRFSPEYFDDLPF